MVQARAHHGDAPTDRAIVLVMVAAVHVDPAGFMHKEVKRFVRRVWSILDVSGSVKLLAHIGPGPSKRSKIGMTITARMNMIQALCAASGTSGGESFIGSPHQNPCGSSDRSPRLRKVP